MYVEKRSAVRDPARRYFKKNPDTIAMTRIAAPSAKKESTVDSVRASGRDAATGVDVLALATSAMDTSRAGRATTVPVSLQSDLPANR